MHFAYGFSIAASLLGVAYLSRIGGFGGTVGTSDTEPEDEDDAEMQQHVKLTEQAANLGVSSCSRLTLMSDSGGIDTVLERCRQMIPSDIFAGRGPSFRTMEA